MNMPWQDKTGLAKATAFFATLLLVSIGLCGVNFVGVMMFSSMDSGAGPGWNWKILTTYLLIGAGWLEVLGMIVGALGLVGVAISSAIRATMHFWKDR